MKACNGYEDKVVCAFSEVKTLSVLQRNEFYRQQLHNR